jgi:hypothetical protein
MVRSLRPHTALLAAGGAAAAIGLYVVLRRRRGAEASSPTLGQQSTATETRHADATFLAAPVSVAVGQSVSPPHASPASSTLRKACSAAPATLTAQSATSHGTESHPVNHPPAETGSRNAVEAEDAHAPRRPPPRTVGALPPRAAATDENSPHQRPRSSLTSPKARSTLTSPKLRMRGQTKRNKVPHPRHMTSRQLRGALREVGINTLPAEAEREELVQLLLDRQPHLAAY